MNKIGFLILLLIKKIYIYLLKREFILLILSSPYFDKKKCLTDKMYENKEKD